MESVVQRPLVALLCALLLIAVPARATDPRPWTPLNPTVYWGPMGGVQRGAMRTALGAFGAIVTSPSATHTYALVGSRFLVTTNEGRSWANVPLPLDEHDITTFYDEPTLWCPTDTSLFINFKAGTVEYRLYRYSSASRQWTRVQRDGLPVGNPLPHRHAVLDGETVVDIQSDTSYVSFDGGRSWPLRFPSFAQRANPVGVSSGGFSRQELYLRRDSSVFVISSVRQDTTSFPLPVGNSRVYHMGGDTYMTTCWIEGERGRGRYSHGITTNRGVTWQMYDTLQATGGERWVPTEVTPVALRGPGQWTCLISVQPRGQHLATTDDGGATWTAVHSLPAGQPWIPRALPFPSGFDLAGLTAVLRFDTDGHLLATFDGIERGNVPGYSEGMYDAWRFPSGRTMIMFAHSLLYTDANLHVTAMEAGFGDFPVRTMRYGIVGIEARPIRSIGIDADGTIVCSDDTLMTWGQTPAGQAIPVSRTPMEILAGGSLMAWGSQAIPPVRYTIAGGDVVADTLTGTDTAFANAGARHMTLLARGRGNRALGLGPAGIRPMDLAARSAAAPLPMCGLPGTEESVYCLPWHAAAMATDGTMLLGYRPVRRLSGTLTPGGLFRYRPGDTSWTPLAAGLPEIGPSDSTVIFSMLTTEDGTILAAAGQMTTATIQRWMSVQRSTDGGTTWSTVFGEPWSAPTPQFSKCPLLQDDQGTLYYASVRNGVLVSTDDGRTWQPLGDDLLLSREIYDLALAPDGRVVVATDSGLAVLERPSSVEQDEGTRYTSVWAYPSPARRNLTVRLNNLDIASGALRCVVVDAQGRVALDLTDRFAGSAGARHTEVDVDVSALAPGWYMVHLRAGTAEDLCPVIILR